MLPRIPTVSPGLMVAMLPRYPNLVVEQRREPDISTLWGLRDTRRGSWLGVIFASRSDAEDALQILQAPPGAIEKRRKGRPLVPSDPIRNRRLI